jgi:glucosamine--fructose-6-phosphate aminotransferase (isomerizing)
MCGIFGYIGNKQNAGDIILDGLKTLEYRGYDSWGVAIKNDKKQLFLEKHTGTIGEATLPKITSTIGIGHTRWATHGGVTRENAHPHTDCSGKIIIVHNGIVENFESLKADLLKKGHHFLSETDSEVIAHLVEEEYKTDKNEKTVVETVWKKLAGLSAIIVFFTEKELFYVIKNGSPLVLSNKGNERFVASDSSALLPYTNEMYFVKDNELLEISREGICRYNNEKKQEIQYIKLDIDPVTAEKGIYDHFMLKEIHEQPQILKKILDTQKKEITTTAGIIKKSYGAYLLGCGTAYYACLAGTYLFSKIANRHINAQVSSEFTYSLDFLKSNSLVIALSQSGETIDTISSIRAAQKKQAKILAISNALESSLYRLADHNLLLGAGPEKAVASTKAYTAKIAFLYLIAHVLGGSWDEGQSNLKKAIQEVQKLLAHQEKIRELAESIKHQGHIFVLGRGVSYAAALESSLKIKEVSYIHAEGFAAAELKHGVIALIEKGTPVIIFNPEDETYEDTLSSAYEVKAWMKSAGSFKYNLSTIRVPSRSKNTALFFILSSLCVL